MRLALALVLLFAGCVRSRSGGDEVGVARPSERNSQTGTVAAGPSGAGLVKTDPGIRARRDSAMGVNIDSLGYYQKCWPFIDAVKMGTPLISGGQKWNDGRPFPTDADGWPTRLLADQNVALIVPNAWKGQKVLSYEGKAAIRVSGDTEQIKIISQKPGRIVLDGQNSQGILITISEVDPQDHIRNLRVVPLDMEAEAEARVFHPLFLERLSAFSVVRAKDLHNTDGVNGERPLSSFPRSWKDRVDPRAFSQAGPQGAAYEWGIELANLLGIDLWISVPHTVDEDYVEQMATLYRDRLRPDVKLWVEYSNEVWNDMFMQAGDAVTRGKARGLDDNDNVARLKFQVLRSVQMFKTFERVFGGRDRLVRVMGSQTGNTFSHDVLLGYEDAAKSIDVLAIAPYFGHEIGSREAVPFLEKDGVEAVFKRIDEVSLKETIEGLERSAKSAKKFGVALVAYEGGQHLVMNPGDHNNEKLVGVLTAANRDPRMKGAYERLFSAWFQAGGRQFAAFTLAGPPTKYGSWGLLERIDQPIGESPKMSAVSAFALKPRSW